MTDEMTEQRRKEQASMAREICLHRGEDPSSVNRYGLEGWEKYRPLAGAVIRESERLFALRSLPAQGEPVVWRVQRSGCNYQWEYYRDKPAWASLDRYDVEPLYAAPAALLKP